MKKKELVRKRERKKSRMEQKQGTIWSDEEKKKKSAVGPLNKYIIMPEGPGTHTTPFCPRERKLLAEEKNCKKKSLFTSLGLTDKI